MPQPTRRKREMPRSPGEADALGLLGLAHRAGMVVRGVAETRRALGAGELALVVFAGDASSTQLEKIQGMLRHRTVPVRWISGRAMLGRALGGGPISAAGVRRSGFLARLLESLSPTPPGPGEARESIEAQEKRGSGHAGR
jgi:ribosomal protein L7Ae-like RNA K-turn-binding protein